MCVFVCVCERESFWVPSLFEHIRPSGIQCVLLQVLGALCLCTWQYTICRVYMAYTVTSRDTHACMHAPWRHDQASKRTLPTLLFYFVYVCLHHDHDVLAQRARCDVYVFTVGSRCYVCVCVLVYFPRKSCIAGINGLHGGRFGSTADCVFGLSFASWLCLWRCMHLYVDTNTHTYMHTFRKACKHAKSTYTHIRTYIHTHTHICTFRNSEKHAKSARIHTSVRTYIHTYTITYIYTLRNCLKHIKNG